MDHFEEMADLIRPEKSSDAIEFLKERKLDNIILSSMHSTGLLDPDLKDQIYLSDLLMQFRNLKVDE